MGIERFGVNREFSQEDVEILSLLDEIFSPVEPRPKNYLIGDGKSWIQEVGNNFDKRRRINDFIEIRNKLNQKLDRLTKRCYGEQKTVIRKIQLVIAKSDDALVEVALLVGLRPSEGLYAKFKDIASGYE